MDSRPLAVSMIGWLLTGGSALMLLVLAFTYPHRRGPDAREILPPGMRWGQLFAWPAALLVVGPGILTGREWGRIGLMLVCAGLVAEAVAARRGARSILIRAAIGAAFAFFLFGEAANAYFGRSRL